MKAAIIIAAVGLAFSANAATINYADSASVGNGAVGNVITKTNGLFTVMATGWEAGTGSGPFAQARLRDYGTAGLGVCTASEIASGGVCSSSGNPSEHQVDNLGQRELVMFQFSDALGKVAVTNISIQMHFLASDWDISYWLGNTNNAFGTSSLLGLNTTTNLTAAGFGTRVDVLNNNNNPALANVNGVVTFNFNNVNGFNTLIFGPTLLTNYTGNDGFKIKSISFTADPNIPTNEQIPEPGTYVLLGGGLIGMALLRRRN